MLVQPQGEAPSTSPLRITSLPSLSSYHTSSSAPSTSQPPFTTPSIQTTPGAEEAAPMPHESPLHSVHSLGSDEVKKLENTIKSGKARRRARIILSEDEDAVEDSSKQGRKISKIDKDPTISMVQDEGTLWFKEDVVIQEKNNADTKILLEEE
ncbi:hypothetical protein Tco_0124552 [Tanacetum coccineum]